jgi:hypothetical protein
MAVRLKTHWFQEGRERGPEQQASVIAAAIWKTAIHGLDGLRKAKYTVDVGAPYLSVLTEFLLFLATAADRWAYLAGEREERFAGDWRVGFTTALAKRLGDIYRENMEHLVGPFVGGERFGTLAVPRPDGYAQHFIALLNERMAEYADFGFADEGPEFAFMRYFGSCIEECLPDAEDRKWVLDQVISVQAPEALKIVGRGMRGVLGADDEPRRPRSRGLAGD